MLYWLVMRLLRSRLGVAFFDNLSSDRRQTLLWQVWNRAEGSLSLVERYRLRYNTYRTRKMHYVPLTNSAEQMRVAGFFRLVDLIRQVEGDIVECGVGRGVSLASLLYAAALFRLPKTVYGFDSFAGFPDATAEDLSGRVKEIGKSPGGWENTSPELIETYFALDQQFADSLLKSYTPTLRLVPGFFEDTLAANLPERIALLHVDCDLYSSTRTVLEQCLPRMTAGGIILFDEYHTEQWPGEKQAADEICARWQLPIQYFDFAQRYGVQLPLTFEGKPLSAAAGQA
jgi:hypothetical protein